MKHGSTSVRPGHRARRTGPPRRPQRLAALLAVLALVLASQAWAGPTRAAAAPINDFTPAFHAQDNGGIALFGNNLMSCPTDNARCAAARNATPGPGLKNNDWGAAAPMAFVDVDSDPATFNSSSSDVVLPPTADVLFARLYWGGRTLAGLGGVAATTSTGSMLLKAPGGDYQSVTASHTDVSVADTALGKAYQSYATVTDLVRAGGTGTYFGADVAAATGGDRYAGWALVVAYHDSTQPVRDLTVFDGFEGISGTNSDSFTVNGFVAPPSGPVRTRVGVVAWEGDLSLLGDSLALNDTSLSTPLSAKTNFFNSTDDRNGVSVTARNPADRNLFGVDIKNVPAAGAIHNGDTSATLKLFTNGDAYFPGVVTTVIDLYAPNFLPITKSVTDLDGHSPARVGDTLRYSLKYTNVGQDAADRSVIHDALPANLSLVPGTLAIAAGANAGPKTDAAGDDQADYDPATRTVAFRVGTGADGATGGTLAALDPTQTAQTDNASTATFDVTVDRAAAGTSIDNSSSLDYRAHTLGTDLVFAGNTVSTPVDTLADLAVTASAAPNPAAPGAPVTFTFGVVNNGPSDAVNSRLTFPLPPGTSFASATGPAGDCTVDAGVVSCPLGTLANGAATTVTITVDVAPDTAPGDLSGTATVATDTAEQDTTNNTATAATTLLASADLQVTKSVVPAVPVAGQLATYGIDVHNAGPSDASAVVVTDVLQTGQSASGPPQLEGANGNCTVTGQELDCTIDVLPAGATAHVALPVDFAASLAPGTFTNTVTATSSTPDPDPGNNVGTVSGPDAAEVDLSLTKRASSPVLSGGTVTWTLTATNHGPSDATGVVFTDTPPTATTVTSATVPGVDGASCTTGVTVRCTVDRLASGAAVTVLITAGVAAGTSSDLVNTATVQPTDQLETNPADNTATAVSPVRSPSLLGVTKTVTPAALIPGQPAVYHIAIRSLGTADALAVTMRDPLPSGITATAASADQAGATCTVAATVSCDIGTIAAGTTVTVDISVDVAADFVGSSLTNTATVTSVTDAPGPVPGPTTGQVDSPVQPQVLATIAKTVDNATPLVGDVVQFTVTVAVGGTVDAVGLFVDDRPPAGLTITDTTPSVGSYSATTGRWTIGALPAGSRASLVMSARVEKAGLLTNTAVIDPASPGIVAGPRTRASASETASTEATAPPVLPELPLTGVRAESPALWGAGLIVVGLVLTLVPRRRRDRDPS